MTQFKSVWPGFWPRVGAFLVDSIVLGLVGYGFGALAYDQLAAMGSPARLIGLVASTAYFGLLSCGLFGSRTLGMRLMKLKVVGLDGRPLGVVRSLGRALILTLPMTLNGLFLPIDDPMLVAVFGIFAATCVFGGSLAQIYLLVFNRPSRRLVHDLVFRSAVVKAHTNELPDAKLGVHGVIAFLIVGLSAAATAAAMTVFQGWLPRSIQTMQKPLIAVQALPEVIEAGVQDNTTTFVSTDGPSRTTRTLLVTARLRTWPQDTKAEIARVGKAALKTYTLAPGQRLQVKLIYGFDIGIASGWRAEIDDFENPPPKPTPASSSAPSAAQSASSPALASGSAPGDPQTPPTIGRN